MFDSTDRFPTQLADITVSGFSASASLGIRCLNKKVINSSNNNVSFTFLFKEKEQSAGFLGWYINNLEYGTKEFLVDVPMFGIMKTWRCVFTTKLAENVVSTEVRKISMTARILDDLTLVRNVYNSLLSMSLINSLEMTQGAGDATFTRASAATYRENNILKYASIDEPRFESNGVLTERSSENIATYSSIDSANWSATRADITVGDKKFIDSIENMAKVICNEDGQVYIDQQYLSISGQAYSQSFYVEKGNTDGLFRIVFHANSFTDSIAAYFDLNLGTVEHVNDGVTANIEYISDGIYRISATAVATTDNTTDNYLSLLYATNNLTVNDYFYVCGAQLEKNTETSSYIKTVDTPILRSRDIFTVPMESNFIDLSSGEEFTISFDFNYGGNTTESNQWIIANYVDSINNFGMYVTPTNEAHFTFDGNGTLSDVSYMISTNTQTKVIICFEDNIFSVYINNVLIGETLSKGMTTSGNNYIIFGGYNLTTNNLGRCNYKNIKTFNVKLTDRERALL